VGECFEDGTGAARELLAVCSQGDYPVLPGSQARGASDGFELADLAGGDNVRCAELTGGA
jgi:hypothetical protein